MKSIYFSDLVVWLNVDDGVMRVALHQLQHLRDTLSSVRFGTMYVGFVK